MVYSNGGTGMLTSDEFVHHPAANERSELVRGRIHMMSPASPVHGLVSARVLHLLVKHVEHHRVGACFADSTGYALPNLANTVRAPDASFVRADRLPEEGVGYGFFNLAPDLAVEVLSPSESTTDIAEKLSDYRIAGTGLVWVIDPQSRTVTVIAHSTSARTLTVADQLTGGEVLPGFACKVSELFEGLAPMPTQPRSKPGLAA